MNVEKRRLYGISRYGRIYSIIGNHYETYDVHTHYVDVSAPHQICPIKSPVFYLRLVEKNGVVGDVEAILNWHVKRVNVVLALDLKQEWRRQIHL